MARSDRSQVLFPRQVPHCRAILETLPPEPLPPPSAAAARFLTPDPSPADLDPAGWIEPTEALAKSAKLFHAQSEVSA